MWHVIASCMAFTVCSVCSGQETNVMGRKDARHAIEGVLKSAQVSGSLVYWGQCDALRPMPDFPNVSRLPKSWGGDSPLQALRAMFSNNPRMHVTQDASGKIRMIESDVPRDLLDVRISHISFKDYDGQDGVWSPKQARRIIEHSPEVRAFMQSHKIAWALDAEYLNDISGGRSPKLPHVSGDLFDVTVAEALDYVSESFPGLWIYENCGNEDGSGKVFFDVDWIPTPPSFNK